MFMLTWAALNSVANAQTGATPFRGLGFVTCAELSAWDKQSLDIGYMIQWIYGYWSAENRSLSLAGSPMRNIMHSTLDPLPLTAQLLAICSNEPGLWIYAAADRVFDRLPDGTFGD